MSTSTIRRLLVIVALIFAVASFVFGGPHLVVAVILLAIALLI